MSINKIFYFTIRLKISGFLSHLNKLANIGSLHISLSHSKIQFSVHAVRAYRNGHMCYSEFNDIIQSIAEMDADVITIETSRSDMELLDVFDKFQYPNEIGFGVYGIHSPVIPSVDPMVDLMQKAT